MDGPAFDVGVTRAEGGEIEIRPVGELDVASAPELAARVDAAVADRPGDVVIVLDAVTFIDSTGVVALLDLLGVVTAAGRRLRLAAPTAAVAQVLELTGLTGQFEIS